MPRNPKYPLEPLREHRARTVEAATVQLGDAVRAREAADAAKRIAEERRHEAEVRVAAVRKNEADLLGRDGLRVADLAHAQAWEHAAGAELADLGRAVARAEEGVTSAAGAESHARAGLATKKADLDVVAKDHARFADGVRRAGEAAEQEAADETFVARRARE